MFLYGFKGFQRCPYDGKIYGVPPGDKVVSAFGYLVRDDLLQKYGISIDENKLYTLDDVEDIFEKVKAGEGRNFYCYIPSIDSETPMSESYIPFDKVSGSASGGVLMLNRNFNDLNLVNLYETDEYKSYAQRMYRWAQKGYISSDAVVTNEFPNTLFKSGNYLGMIADWYPKSINPYIAEFGMPLTCIKLVDFYAACNGGWDIMWNISSTSINPEKAMQALNYIYQHNEANWLIQFGIEGKSYEVLENTPDGMIINYLSEDTSQLPYFNPYGLWGSVLEWPAVYPMSPEVNKRKREMDAAAPKTRYSPAIGYSFKQESVVVEIASVKSVIQQYVPGIDCGTTNPDSILPEFIAALKAAGIDKIIAENQRQINAWAATKN
jgi:putative aldouronate transport system substrate-binding protein